MTAVNSKKPDKARTASRMRPGLPDPTAGGGGPYRPFASDPGRDEAWWWLGIPLAVVIFLTGVSALAPEAYRAWVIPEGYGFLELGQFLIASAGMIAALALVWRPFVRRRRLLLAFAVLASLACLYIAGEEHSWGQHFFYWETPEYWARINRQQETNLHNVIDLLDKKPRLLLEIGVFGGGLLIPLLALFWRGVRASRWSLFLPANALVPTALGALLFKTSATLQTEAGWQAIVFRPAEATEFYLYLFILIYLIVFARRIGELEREAAR